MIPASHHGAWRGPNRLWLEDPATPERSQGTLDDCRDPEHLVVRMFNLPPEGPVMPAVDLRGALKPA